MKVSATLIIAALVGAVVAAPINVPRDALAPAAVPRSQQVSPVEVKRNEDLGNQAWQAAAASYKRSGEDSPAKREEGEDLGNVAYLPVAYKRDEPIHANGFLSPSYKRDPEFDNTNAKRDDLGNKGWQMFSPVKRFLVPEESAEQ